MTLDPRTPILVGAGQFTQRTAREGKVAESLSPIAMMEKVAKLAFDDTGAGGKIASALDTVAVVRFDLRIEMRVQIDEAGRNGEAAGVDLFLALGCDLADLANDSVLDTDVAAERFAAGAVYDAAAADHNVMRHGKSSPGMFLLQQV